MCQEPFTQMVHKYQNLVFSICVKMTGDYFAAEDLTQETFLSAYRHKEEFDGKNEKAWLCRIASNKCIDYSRQAARRMVPTEDEVLGSHPARAGGPEEQCIEEVIREELQEKIDVATATTQPDDSDSHARETLLKEIRSVSEILKDPAESYERKGLLLRSIVDGITYDKEKNRLYFNFFIS